MLVTEVKSNIHQTPLPEGIHVETIMVSSDQLLKRIQRVQTDHGRELAVRLPKGAPDLKDGDVLDVDQDNAIVLRVEPTDVIVIRPRSIEEMGVIAHSLGNRHLQAQFFGGGSAYGAEVMVVQFDHTVVQYLEAVGAQYDRQARVLPTPFRHAEHHH